MIQNEEKEGWHYLVVKKLSVLLRRITSKHDAVFMLTLKIIQKILQQQK